jgi:hypothetical protein
MKPKFQLKPITNPSGKRALKLKPLIPEKKLFVAGKLYFSGYAITDNLNFILFDVDKQFLLDNFIQDDILGFNFSEESVDMRIDRNVSLHPIIHDSQVVFENFGSVEKRIFNLAVINSPRGSFMPVMEWFGEKVNSLICCISETGKPVAVVKTI